MCGCFTLDPTTKLYERFQIQNRMPVILEPKAEEVWLNPEVTDPGEVTPLLHPYAVKALSFYPVSKP
jgi:putative SOS response-associated peptidase YedK